MRISRDWTLYAIGALGAGMMAFAWSSPAWPHQAIPTAAQTEGWNYPWSCCSGQDCARIPAARVTTEPDGYHIQVTQGDHPLVSRPTLFVVAYNDRKIKISPDGEYHLCISKEYRGTNGSTTPSRLICFFAPPQAY